MRCRVEVLSRDEIYDIHDASLEILEYTGATFRSKEALKIFDDYGAIVDYEKFNVKLPAYMVKELVRKAPNKFWIYGRIPKHNVKMGGKTQFLGSSGDYPYVVDMDGKRRYGLLKDCENLIRIEDALENIRRPYSPVRYPHDVPEELEHVEVWMAHYKNTSKPTHIYGVDRYKAKDVLELAAMAAGGEEELRKKPTAMGSFCPDAPLLFDAELTEHVIECARFGLSVGFFAMDNVGATAPITLAGTVVQTNATNLAGVCLIQIINPGLGVTYGSIPVVMDLRTGIPSVGCPEQALHAVATTQMANYYRLPSIIASGVSDSKIVDAQAGYESALTLLPALLAGTNCIDGYAGGLEFHFSASYEMLVIHDEIFGMAKRIAEGIEVNEDTMAVSVINKIAPLAATRAGGHFMAEKHTLEHIDKERYIPKISDKTTRDIWEKAGSKDIRQVARERVKEILAKHVPEPPPPDILKELDKKAEEIKKRILKRKKQSSG